MGWLAVARPLQRDTHPPFNLYPLFAMSPQIAFPAPQNFLFMVPSSVGGAELEIIFGLARKFTSLGYVYIASAHEKSMVDREDIRFMPLHEAQLPAFGELTAVFVVKDQTVVEHAKQAYPDAHVLLLNPVRVAEELEEYDAENVVASWPVRSALWEQPMPRAKLAVAA